MAPAERAGVECRGVAPHLYVDLGAARDERVGRGTAHPSVRGGEFGRVGGVREDPRRHECR